MFGQTTRPSDSQQEKNENERICRVKLKESEKRDKYEDLARELKTLWNMKVTVIPTVIGALGTIPKGVVKGQEQLKNKRTCGDHPNNTALFAISQNIEKSRGDLRKLAVTQTSVKNHQLNAGGKTSEMNNNENSPLGIG